MTVIWIQHLIGKFNRLASYILVDSGTLGVQTGRRTGKSGQCPQQLCRASRKRDCFALGHLPQHPTGQSEPLFGGIKNAAGIRFYAQNSERLNFFVSGEII